MAHILPPSFYQHADVVKIARALLGKVIVSQVDGVRTEGRIVETEAYQGANDRACHAYQKRRTPRTETMFLPGGHAYVYLCYGLHHLFNVVTNVENEPDAVLIRAVEPLVGLETMMERRKMKSAVPKLTSGPGCVAQALGIGRLQNKTHLVESDQLWVEDQGFTLLPEDIGVTTRVGVSYAGEDALRPWRFYIKGNPWVSALPKTG